MRIESRFNQRFLRHLFFVALLICTARSFAKEESGLILSGIDTLFINGYCFGFDFVLQRACTSATDNQCNAHFNVGWSTENAYLAWLMGQGLVSDLGKLNLDSIKAAPPDSLMKDDLGLGQLYRIFRIVPDSLQKCVGNCYIMKTGVDPRPIWNRPFYAKIKIIKFIVVDSVTHAIRMVFLWAYQNSGTHDITTSGLDTFHLDTPTLNRPNSRFANSNNSIQNDILITQRSSAVSFALSANSTTIGIYDIDGRLVVELPVTNGTAVWRGTSAAAKPASTGRYFVHVLEGKQNVTRAFLLVR
jgi:hypothetical protein